MHFQQSVQLKALLLCGLPHPVSRDRYSVMPSSLISTPVLGCTWLHRASHLKRNEKNRKQAASLKGSGFMGETSHWCNTPPAFWSAWGIHLLTVFTALPSETLHHLPKDSTPPHSWAKETRVPKDCRWISEQRLSVEIHFKTNKQKQKKLLQHLFFSLQNSLKLWFSTVALSICSRPGPGQVSILEPGWSKVLVWNGL